MLRLKDNQDRTYFLPFDHIMWVQATGDGVCLQDTSGRQYLFPTTQQLRSRTWTDQGFVRAVTLDKSVFFINPDLVRAAMVDSTTGNVDLIYNGLGVSANAPRRLTLTVSPTRSQRLLNALTACWDWASPVVAADINDHATACFRTADFIYAQANDESFVIIDGVRISADPEYVRNIISLVSASIPCLILHRGEEATAIGAIAFHRIASICQGPAGTEIRIAPFGWQPTMTYTAEMEYLGDIHNLISVWMAARKLN